MRGINIYLLLPLVVTASVLVITVVRGQSTSDVCRDDRRSPSRSPCRQRSTNLVSDDHLVAVVLDLSARYRVLERLLHNHNDATTKGFESGEEMGESPPTYLAECMATVDELKKELTKLRQSTTETVTKVENRLNEEVGRTLKDFKASLVVDWKLEMTRQVQMHENLSASTRSTLEEFDNRIDVVQSQLVTLNVTSHEQRQVGVANKNTRSTDDLETNKLKSYIDRKIAAEETNRNQMFVDFTNVTDELDRKIRALSAQQESCDNNLRSLTIEINDFENKIELELNRRRDIALVQEHIANLSSRIFYEINETKRKQLEVADELVVKKTTDAYVLDLIKNISAESGNVRMQLNTQLEDIRAECQASFRAVVNITDRYQDSQDGDSDYRNVSDDYLIERLNIVGAHWLAEESTRNSHDFESKLQEIRQECHLNFTSEIENSLSLMNTVLKSDIQNATNQLLVERLDNLNAVLNNSLAENRLHCDIQLDEIREDYRSGLISQLTATLSQLGQNGHEVTDLENDSIQNLRQRLKNATVQVSSEAKLNRSLFERQLANTTAEFDRENSLFRLEIEKQLLAIRDECRANLTSSVDEFETVGLNLDDETDLYNYSIILLTKAVDDLTLELREKSSAIEHRFREELESIQRDFHRSFMSEIVDAKLHLTQQVSEIEYNRTMLSQFFTQLLNNVTSQLNNQSAMDRMQIETKLKSIRDEFRNDLLSEIGATRLQLDQRSREIETQNATTVLIVERLDNVSFQIKKDLTESRLQCDMHLESARQEMQSQLFSEINATKLYLTQRVNETENNRTAADQLLSERLNNMSVEYRSESQRNRLEFETHWKAMREECRANLTSEVSETRKQLNESAREAANQNLTSLLLAERVNNMSVELAEQLRRNTLRFDKTLETLREGIETNLMSEINATKNYMSQFTREAQDNQTLYNNIFTKQFQNISSEFASKLLSNKLQLENRLDRIDEELQTNLSLKMNETHLRLDQIDRAARIQEELYSERFNNIRSDVAAESAAGRLEFSTKLELIRDACYSNLTDFILVSERENISQRRLVESTRQHLLNEIIASSTELNVNLSSEIENSAKQLKLQIETLVVDATNQAFKNSTEFCVAKLNDLEASQSLRVTDLASETRALVTDIKEATQQELEQVNLQFVTFNSSLDEERENRINSSKHMTLQIDSVVETLAAEINSTIHLRQHLIEMIQGAADDAQNQRTALDIRHRNLADSNFRQTEEAVANLSETLQLEIREINLRIDNQAKRADNLNLSLDDQRIKFNIAEQRHEEFHKNQQQYVIDNLESLRHEHFENLTRAVSEIQEHEATRYDAFQRYQQNLVVLLTGEFVQNTSAEISKASEDLTARLERHTNDAVSDSYVNATNLCATKMAQLDTQHLELINKTSDDVTRLRGIAGILDTEDKRLQGLINALGVSFASERNVTANHTHHIRLELDSLSARQDRLGPDVMKSVEDRIDGKFDVWQRALSASQSGLEERSEQQLKAFAGDLLSLNATLQEYISTEYDDLQCNDSCQNLGMCVRGRCNCWPGTSGITCEKGYPIRLVNTKDRLRSVGRVEIFYKNAWGTVCDDGFDTHSAAVACRSLNAKYTAGVVLGSTYGEGSGPIWLDDISCIGSETNIGFCRHREWGKSNCGHGEDIAIRCESV